ncbi:hypothetical protein Clacol_004685 [Clathrus columnatus]|uniref:Carboxypeptidase n=1 Tax=Clathrus columnatus TaxID=1419009 RepID=A0AAV5AB61_9AGAM|nr:hypothetical protein Clacol_004685 [Clathrus columnatus]
MIGLFLEHGPCQITGDYSLVPNEYALTRLADVFYIDQPVGAGYSTADATGYIADEEEMGEDFLQFLSNLVEIFPSLQKRPFYLMGESYARHYIPYTTKAYFGKGDPPVRLAGTSVGDGDMAGDASLSAAMVASTRFI